MEKIPREVVIYIFALLDRRSIGRVVALSKKYENICNSEQLWKLASLNSVTEEEHEKLQLETRIANLSWKKTYIQLST